MLEQERIRALKSYKILDTPPEKELDELAEIASVVCNTPVSLLGFIDDHRQWYKAKKGISHWEVPREKSFCQYAIPHPDEVLVIHDPENDPRCVGNPTVYEPPRIRFYAGAPLTSPDGHVLGTLCVLDYKPHEISASQKNALQLLAKKAMDYLNTRKLLQDQSDKLVWGAEQLKKLTDRTPGTVFQLRMTKGGRISFLFVSEGILDVHPKLKASELLKNPEIIYQAIHPDDLDIFRGTIRDSFKYLTLWSCEYRLVHEYGKTTWIWGSAQPEQQDDGSVIWYGTFQDITHRKDYEHTLEQILFDISHVLRRPVASMLGLTSILEKDQLNEEKIREYASKIKLVSQEMDRFTKQLNDVYWHKNLKIAGLRPGSHQFDISAGSGAINKNKV